MRVLLDTNVLLRSAARSAQLSVDARELIEDVDNDVYFSAASIWEIAIKSALRRADFRIDVAVLRASMPVRGFSELPVSADHATAVSRLPMIHRDPFDRLLVAQSIIEPMILLTLDETLRAYGSTVRVV